jgi:hypothetical protein
MNQSLALNLTLAVESTVKGLQQLASSSSLYGNITTPLNAMYQCRGDLISPECGDCVKDASVIAIQRCNYTSQAYVLLDGCVVRYQEMPFFDLDVSSMVWGCDGDPHGYGGEAIMTTYKHDVDKLLNSVILVASSEQSFFNASSVSNGTIGAVKVYGLAQCMAYLSPDQCSFCLSNLDQFASSSRNICSNAPGVRLHYPSCFVRYDNFPFYEERQNSLASGTNTVLAPHPSSSPSNPHPPQGMPLLICFSSNLLCFI